MTIYYLATPYHHQKPEIREERVRIAQLLTADLVSRGMHVFCPIAYGSLLRAQPAIQEWNHEDWMAFDLPFLAKCDILLIAKMHDWHKSRGIQQERNFAAKAGIPVMWLEQVDIVKIIGAKG